MGLHKIRSGSMKLPVPDDQYFPLKAENYVSREPRVLLTRAKFPVIGLLCWFFVYRLYMYAS